MHRRLVFAGLASLLLVADVVAPTRARAEDVPPPLPAPVLLSPVDTTESDVIVDFSWERVDGAVAYVLRVQHGSDTGTTMFTVRTVNDRWIGTVNFAGDAAYWSVTAVDADGSEGAPAGATFTTARVASSLTWPADGATVSFPAEAPPPLWQDVPDQPEQLVADQMIGSPDAIANPPTFFGLGTWRWGVRSTRGPADELPPSPPSETRTFTLEWPGGIPVQTAPADGFVAGPADTMRLAWDRVPGAALYAWELRDAGPADAPVRQASYSGARANWAEVTAPLAAGAYQWRVRAIMSGTVVTTGIPGEWSPFRTFSVTGIGTPDPIFPADGATLSAWPVLRWADVDGARGYTLQVADSVNPDAPFAVPAPSVAAFSFHAGAPGDAYAATTSSATRSWRVRAEPGINGVEPGPWSAWRSFTVDPPDGTLPAETPATLLGPTDCTTDACPDVDGVPLLRWEPVAKAASYRVFLRWDGGSGEPNSWIDTGSTGLPLPQYNVLTPGDRAAWAVLACPDDGCSTTMPAVRWHFRVGLPVPQQLGWADGTVQAAPSIPLQWTAAAAPSSGDALRPVYDYQVIYRRTPGNGTPQDLVYVYGGRQTATTVDAIRDGVTFDWRVRSTANLGAVDPAASAWSPWRTLTREESPVTLLSPAEGATVGSAPILQWQGLDYPALDYRVELSRTSALDAWGPGYWDWATQTGATSVRPGVLNPGTYRWRVKREPGMYFQDDGEGPWASGTFTVEGDPKLHPVSPGAGDTVQANDAVLTWDPWPNVPYYSIMIGTTPDMTWDTAVYVGFAVSSIHPVSKLLPQGDLYWRVCSSLDCSDVTAFAAGSSDPRILHVVSPPGPDTIAPASSIASILPRAGQALTTTGSTPTTISWTAFDVGRGIATQELQLRRGTGAWVSIPVTGSARSATSTLRPASTYTVRVRATDTSGNVGAWSTRQVTTSLRQETSSRWRWSSGWTRRLSSTASGGATRWAKRSGASATISLKARVIALVAPRSSSRGSAQVWIDGVRVATIRLDASPTGARRIAYIKAGPSAGDHRITIKVSGTAGHPRVDIDAIVSFR